MRWSDGSYLEDQDHWWLSGIHRDVLLLAKPKVCPVIQLHLVFLAILLTLLEGNDTVISTVNF